MSYCDPFQALIFIHKANKLVRLTIRHFFIHRTKKLSKLYVKSFDTRGNKKLFFPSISFSSFFISSPPPSGKNNIFLLFFVWAAWRQPISSTMSLWQFFSLPLYNYLSTKMRIQIAKHPRNLLRKFSLFSSFFHSFCWFTHSKIEIAHKHTHYKFTYSASWL